MRLRKIQKIKSPTVACSRSEQAPAVLGLTQYIFDTVGDFINLKSLRNFACISNSIFEGDDPVLDKQDT